MTGNEWGWLGMVGNELLMVRDNWRWLGITGREWGCLGMFGDLVGDGWGQGWSG